MQTTRKFTGVEPVNTYKNSTSDLVTAIGPSPRRAYRSVFKRIFDIFVALLLLPQIVIIVLIAALLVARDGSNPFYTQLRVGRGGRVFKMIKLRSMVCNADEVFNAYLAANPEAKQEWEVNQKLINDPRVTPIGRVIRKTSIDELPQLWNVIRGDMSLVGPRPFMVDQKDLYAGEAYYKLRPGMTGNWQVSDRSIGAFVSRVDFDEAYYRDLSFKEDCRIIGKTVSVLMRATGL